MLSIKMYISRRNYAQLFFLSKNKNDFQTLNDKKAYYHEKAVPFNLLMNKRLSRDN